MSLKVEEVIQPVTQPVKSDKKSDTLDISEDFYSVQCEGDSTGVPAVFIRLRSCNLMCGGKDGSLMNEGKATWWCDTEAVWRKGLQKPFTYLVDRWKKENILEWIADGRVNLIWTGGEPTLPRHQKSIVSFLDWFASNHTNNNGESVYNEIETNGTLYIEDDFFEKLQQINCSVKLQNSGMDSKRRIKPNALYRIMEHDNYWFKFVISTDECLKEIERDFIKPLNIPHNRVLMMPGLDCQKNFHERTRFCLEMAKKYGYRGMSRLHVSAWDKLTGV